MKVASSPRIRRFSSRLKLHRDWYLLSLAALIGLVMGTVAVAFIWPLHYIADLARENASGWRMWVLVAFAPAVGGLLAGLVNNWLRTEMTMPGIPAVMYAIHRNKSRLRKRLGIKKWIASTLTIGSGGSAGAEGPIVTIGAVIGSAVGQYLRATPQNTATLLGCGSAAGLAAVFNAPIAGVFFVMEILLRDFSLRTFTPIVIAAVVASAWSQGLTGTEAIFQVDQTFFKTQHLTVLQIPNYLMLGLLCGVIATLFIRGLSVSENLFDRIKTSQVIKPALGAVILGGLGVAYLLLVQDDGAGLPPFYGNGYPVTQNLLQPLSYTNAGAEDIAFSGRMLTALVALAVFKIIATCLTIGSGGSGGLFAPSLLIGAAVGGAFGSIVNGLDWFPAASPATYAIVGMAAMVAATTHAPLTAILIVYEITRSYEIMLPLMLAAVISTIVGRLVFPESIYTIRLSKLGVRIGAMSDLTILRRLFINDVILAPAVTVRDDASAQRLLELSEQRNASDFVVVDERGHYVGMVTADDLKAALVYREAIPLLQVSELLRSDLPTIQPDDSLDRVLNTFSKYDVQALPVMDESGDGSVRGLITRTRLMQAYQQALEER